VAIIFGTSLAAVANVPLKTLRGPSSRMMLFKQSKLFL